MNEIVSIYSQFIIALLGVIAPIFGILITIFHSGFQKLRLISEEELELKRKALAKERESKNDGHVSTDLKNLSKDFRRLENKLKRLTTPARQIGIMFFWFLMSLAFVLGCLIAKRFISELPNRYWSWGILLFLSLIALSFGLYTIWRLITVLIEVRKLITEDVKVHEKKLTDLLEKIVEKLSTSLSDSNVYLSLNGTKINNDTKLSLQRSSESTFSIKLINDSNTALQNAEFGIKFPHKKFEVVTEACQLNHEEDMDVLSISSELIHAKDKQLIKDIIVKCAEKGEHKIVAFIRGSNIDAPIDKIITITVVDTNVIITNS